MNAEQLFQQIVSKKSFLCVGLDTDIKKIPEHLMGSEDPIFEFNKAIIDATAKYTVAYKPNLAFYEEQGIKGWMAFVKTVEYLRANYPEQFIIADAKRGDIGNTSAMYARAFFEQADVDAVTLSPYMGSDTVAPFFDYKDKWAVILALTSNPSAAEFEMQTLEGGDKVYEKVIKTSSAWGNLDNTMYVVGATKAEMLAGIRRLIPEHFLLVPGVGAQGGSLEEVVKYGMNSRCGLLVNSSRAIIYASKGTDFAELAAVEAANVQAQMEALMGELLAK